MSITRPILRYHGGKFRIRKWIIAHMPKHKVYVEAFGGAGSVLLEKPRVGAEVYNDLDGRVVNVFRVLQDPIKALEVCRRLELTPYARAEFDRCYELPVEDIDNACKTLALTQMGYGTDSIGRTCRTGFRSKLSGSGITPASSWSTWPRGIRGYVERLRGVVIENRPAIEVMERLDGLHTLHYADPPYVTSTRSSLSSGRGASHGYRCEMTDTDHRQLAQTLKGLRGMVLLSGYNSALYDELYGDWQQFECEAFADGAAPRIERLWLNARASDRYNRQGTLQMQEAA